MSNPTLCAGTKKNGQPCRAPAVIPARFCRHHLNARPNQSVPELLAVLRDASPAWMREGIERARPHLPGSLVEFPLMPADDPGAKTAAQDIEAALLLWVYAASMINLQELVRARDAADGGQAQPDGMFAAFNANIAPDTFLASQPADWIEKVRSLDIPDGVKEAVAALGPLLPDDTVASTGTPPSTQRQTPALTTQDGLLRIPANDVCKALMQSLPPGKMTPLTEAQWNRATKALSSRPFKFGFCFGPQRKNVSEYVCGVIGFKNQPSEGLFKSLQQLGPLAVKAAIVLWARAYAETGATPGVPIYMNVSQFCDELGYQRHRHGGHRLESKQKAAAVFDLLTQIDVFFVFQLANGAARKKSGHMWVRSEDTEDYPRYSDLFGSQGLGDPTLWDPVELVYAMGTLLDDPEWREPFSNIASAPCGLLTLRPDKDEWAIYLGGYLATLSRMNGYQPLKFKVATLLEVTGLFNTDRGRPGRRLLKLRLALDRLKEVGVIDAWGHIRRGATEPDPEPNLAEPDMNNPEDLARLCEDPRQPLTEDGYVVIYWPQQVRRLGDAIAAGKARARRHSLTRARKLPTAGGL